MTGFLAAVFRLKKQPQRDCRERRIFEASGALNVFRTRRPREVVHVFLIVLVGRGAVRIVADVGDVEEAPPARVENARHLVREEALAPAGLKRDEPLVELVRPEGVDVERVATVGFERNQRIAQFRIDPDNMKAPFKQLDFLVPAREIRQNRGFETVTHANPYGQHEGGLVVVSEKSLDKAGNIFAAIIEGPHKGVFTVKRNGEFDITDGAFLPDGDLLLLERSFSMARGVKMRLRRIYGESVEKGAVADGPVLMEADMGYQIDNMEGLDVWTRDDGALMVSLVSDDNHSILQRNLYLEFILHQD